MARSNVDLKQLGPDFLRDPYPVYARLRSQGPVHRVYDPDGEEVWLVVGHEACRTAFTDPRLSRDWMRSGNIKQIVNTEQDQPALMHMLMSGPAGPHPAARLVAREFTARRIESLAPRVQQITDELLDAMLAGGGAAGRSDRRVRLPAAHDRHLRTARRAGPGPGRVPHAGPTRWSARTSPEAEALRRTRSCGVSRRADRGQAGEARRRSAQRADPHRATRTATGSRPTN